jgi:hypothetical protein
MRWRENDSMRTVILLIILSTLIALVAGIVASWDKLTSGDKAKRILGVLALVLILAGQGLQGYQTWLKQTEVNEKDERIRISNEFREQSLAKIDEASGGALVEQGRVAYLVDDEEPLIYKLKFDDKQRRYEFDNRFEIKLNGASKITDYVREDADDKGDKCTKRKEFDDFEGAAEYKGDLYVITSHSDRQNGDRCRERKWLLQLSLKEGHVGEVIRGTNRLRKAILDEFQTKRSPQDDVIGTDRKNRQGNRELMNIEGLAIDDGGKIYIGFREPMAGGTHAIVLSAKLDECFGEKPVFERHLLELQHMNALGALQNYAIVSMDYDARRGSILILGNSIEREEAFNPVIWSWPIKETGADQKLKKGKEFVIEKPEYAPSAKAEVLLAPPGDNLYFFLDSERYGGQRVYTRDQLGLE